MVFVRGDHKVEDIKLTNALGASFRAATEEELPGPAGFLGPVDGVEELWDAAITPGRYVTGAGRPDWHRTIEVPAGPRADVRTVVAGDTVDGHAITIEPAIEVGNIFKLGTRYSVPLGATYLDENGKEQPIVMGSYGIGPARIVAAAIEQFADDRGIAWPRSLSPWDVHVVALGKKGGGPELDAATALYEELTAGGLDVLLDDRDAGTGAKLTDAELLGVPLRLAIGRRGVEAGAAEAQLRRGQQDVEGGVPLTGAADRVRALLEDAP
jgi:prolyl-tRNA synthetase